MRRRDFCSGASAALGAALLSGCVPPPATQRTSGTEVAHPLAGITTFDGKAIPLPALVGKVTVVDFWASWCAPCRQAFPYLDQLYRTYAADGLQVIGVGVDSDPQDGRQFFARLRPRFQVVWDPSGEVRERFSVVGLPTTLIIDEQAKLIHRHEGFDKKMHQLVEAHVRRLLQR